MHEFDKLPYPLRLAVVPIENAFNFVKSRLNANMTKRYTNTTFCYVFVDTHYILGYLCLPASSWADQ